MKRRNVQLDRQAKALGGKIAAETAELEAMEAFCAFLTPHMKGRENEPIGKVVEELKARGIVYTGPPPPGMIRVRR